MMSRMSQTEMIANVQGSSRIRGNYKDNTGKGSTFAQLFEQEQNKLRQQEFNGVSETDQADMVDNRMDGKVHVYDNHGMINYFRMTMSMTDLKG